MEYIRKDPIIEAYFNFRNANENKIPVFSETVLSLSVKHVLNYKYKKQEDVLSLYRKLIVLLYSEKYKSIDDMQQIMTCFDRDSLIACIENMEEIQENWKMFTVEEMIHYIRKNAFFIIMSEWKRRYVFFFGQNLLEEKLGEQTLHVHGYFNWPVKSAYQWKRSFVTNFIKRIHKESNDHDLSYMTHSDLSLRKIAFDLKDKLHPLIHVDALKRFIGSIKSLNYETLKEIKLLTPGCAEVSSLINKEKEKCNLSKIIKNAEVNNPIKTETNVQSDEDDKDDEFQIVHILEVSDNESYDSLENQRYRKKQKLALETNIDTKIKDEYIEPADDEFQNPTKIVGENVVPNSLLIKIERSDTIKIIDDEKATKYLSALQAYAVENGLYEAIGLLDQVDSIMRSKLYKKTW